MAPAENTEREQDQRVTRAPAWLLTIVHHDDVALPGRRTSLRAGEQLELGRACDAFGPGALDAPLVSRRHAMLTCDDTGTLTIRDLESTNGIWRNGDVVSTVVLETGDIVRVGIVLLAVRRVPGIPVPHRDAPFPTTSPAAHALYQTLVGLDSDRKLVLVLGEPDTGVEGVAEALRRSHAIAHPVEYIANTRVDPSLSARVLGKVVLVGPLPFAHAEAQSELMSSLMGSRAARVVCWWPSRNETATDVLARSLFVEQLDPVVVSLPRVCERLEDIPLFMVSFAQRHHGRVATLHHALALALLRSRWPGNLRGLEEFVRVHLAPHGDDTPIVLTREHTEILSVPESQVPEPQRFVRVSLDGAWFELVGTERVLLQNRYALTRILSVLAHAHRNDAGDTVSSESLIEAGWPGQRLMYDATVHRLHVAIGTLRKLGLREALTRQEHGYRLEGVVIETGSPPSLHARRS